MIVIGLILLACFIIVLILAETAPEYEECKDGSFKLVEKPKKNNVPSADKEKNTHKAPIDKKKIFATFLLTKEDTVTESHR